VSWKDASKYVEWLSARTDKPYRLLSEAEWEYVARARTTTKYWWGDEIDWRKQQANFAWRWADRGGRLEWWLRQKLTLRPRWGLSTGPVDICEPNPWGLFNVHGNVDEWVGDNWHETYDGAPVDGRPWLADEGASADWRVVRGGSWSSMRGHELYAHVRTGRQQDHGYNWVGFRVARTLPPRT
jgi:formylglycine-generating enzyme required for sulfatase activity